MISAMDETRLSSNELNLDNQGISSFPEITDEWKKFKSVSLYKNQLTSVSSALWRLTNLEALNLADNQLKEIADEIGNLVHLRMLDLGHNQLEFIPEAIGQLENLDQFLYMSNNQFKQL